MKCCELTYFTSMYNQWINITEDIKNIVENSGVAEGILTVMTMHTTTGITINEALECLESDMSSFLEKLVPETSDYAHARMLREYGSTAGNPTGHIKALITGNHVHSLIEENELILGSAQEIYFCEFDGPAKRKIKIWIESTK